MASLYSKFVKESLAVKNDLSALGEVLQANAFVVSNKKKRLTGG
jgi:hypothetical protein